MSLPESGLYLGMGDSSLGPLTRTELAARVQEGLPAEALLWFDGQEGWTRLTEHPAYASLQTPGTTALAPKSPPSDDEQDRLFGRLVKQSWQYYRLHESTTLMDDVFVGALITAVLDFDHVLIDLTSDGSNHFLRFERLADKSRCFFQIRHLTQTLASARVEGNRVGVIVGYSERTNDISRLWGTLKQEFRSGVLASPEPGTITFDADMNTGYVSVQIDLFLKIEDYVDSSLRINPAALTRDVSATLNALRKYLAGRSRSRS